LKLTNFEFIGQAKYGETRFATVDARKSFMGLAWGSITNHQVFQEHHDDWRYLDTGNKVEPTSVIQRLAQAATARTALIEKVDKRLTTAAEPEKWPQVAPQAYLDALKQKHLANLHNMASSHQGQT
jgi:hypothetical protein